MTTERALVEAARAGEHSAFAQLVELYQRPVYNLAFRMLGNPRDAEDASQESFLKAFRALDRYDCRRSFSTWLLAVTAHHCIDRLRRRRLKLVSLDALPPWRWVPVDTVDPEHSAQKSDRQDLIGRLLEGLPDDYRLVLVLRYWHDLGYAEIADMLGDTESAVKSRLHRARRQMAARLEAEYADDEGRTDGSGRHTEPQAAEEGIGQCTAMMPAS